MFPNVRDHRHRTAGATDAGEERALASGVTAGRCSVHRSVRSLVPSTLDVEPWSASSSCFLFIPTLDGGTSLVSSRRIGIHSKSRPFKPATRSCHPSGRHRIRALRLEGDIPSHAKPNPNICVLRERSDISLANVPDDQSLLASAMSPAREAESAGGMPEVPKGQRFGRSAR